MTFELSALAGHQNRDAILAVLNDSPDSTSADDVTLVSLEAAQRVPAVASLEVLQIRNALTELATANPAVAAIIGAIESHPDAVAHSVRQGLMPRSVRQALAPFAPTLHERTTLWQSALAALRCHLALSASL